MCRGQPFHKSRKLPLTADGNVNNMTTFVLQTENCPPPGAWPVTPLNRLGRVAGFWQSILSDMWIGFLCWWSVLVNHSTIKDIWTEMFCVELCNHRSTCSVIYPVMVTRDAAWNLVLDLMYFFLHMGSPTAKCRKLNIVQLCVSYSLFWHAIMSQRYV